ncbi:MAG: helix-turn-helix domain-containing protein [Prevotella sp.]|nr:helix-turn-helix domain-containing protein [Prevotella sp.]
MRKEQKNVNPSHPYIQQLDAIREKDVVVIDDIPSPPLVGEAYITDNCLIIVCQQGEIINVDNDEYALRAHDISILLPDQIAIPQRVTADFRATNVALSRHFYEQMRVSYPYTRCVAHFRRRPPCRLSESQFAEALSLVNAIRSISRSDSIYRHEMLMHMVCILVNMLGEYHVKNYPDERKGKESVFGRFYENIILHYRESRELNYYARLHHLSAKRFAAVIKIETGINATDWITNYVIIRAKMMLDSRKEMTIQQISYYLGFSEQASFSRFFKANAGMTPSEYREKGIDRIG